ATLTPNGPNVAAQAQGGPNSLKATVIKTLICPADALPTPPVVLTYPPGALPAYPEGIYSSLTSYGPNTGTRGWAILYDPPKVDDGAFLVNTSQAIRITDITDGTSGAAGVGLAGAEVAGAAGAVGGGRGVLWEERASHGVPGVPSGGLADRQ